MASLKLIADEISDALARPFDDMFKERIKSVFRHELAAMIRQQVNKNGLDPQFKSRYTTECIPTTIGDSSYDLTTVDNKNFRTKNKIAQPIRYNTDEPFTYVGSIDGKYPYRYVPLVSYQYDDLMPMVKKVSQLENGEELKTPIKWDYRNGYIYVNFNDEQSEAPKLMIEGVHSTYDFISDESKESKDKGIIYNDDLDFPMPTDLIQLVKERLFKGEFSIIDDKDKIPQSNIDNN